MADKSVLAYIWEYMKENGLTVPAEQVTISFAGHEAVVEAPAALVETGASDQAG